MQIHDFSYRIRRFLRLADYAIRWEAMVSEKAKHKAIPGSKVTLDDLIDDGIVREIEGEGFIDRLYGKKG